MSLQLRLTRDSAADPVFREAKSPARPAADAAPRRLSLETLMGGHREVIIQHRGEDYRLRLTSNDKLLLTK